MANDGAHSKVTSYNLSQLIAGSPTPSAIPISTPVGGGE